MIGQAGCAALRRVKPIARHHRRPTNWRTAAIGRIRNSLSKWPRRLKIDSAFGCRPNEFFRAVKPITGGNNTSAQDNRADMIACCRIAESAPFLLPAVPGPRGSCATATQAPRLRRGAGDSRSLVTRVVPSPHSKCYHADRGSSATIAVRCWWE